MSKTIVFGASGQLGQCLKKVVEDHSLDGYIFPDRAEADILNVAAIEALFKKYNPAYCINCAAYTAVDKAESDEQTAFAINKTGAENLADLCSAYNVVLVHISTDFVFGGTADMPLNELSATRPLSIYGESKLAGERVIPTVLNKYFILRTGWLYSEYGNNFVKTILRIGKERGEIKVINDQIGTPTYAMDLAAAITQIIGSGSNKYGLYHYANEGTATWFDFATAIHQIAGTGVTVLPIPTSEYPTPAKRPVYSVMDKSKIKQALTITIADWKDSLRVCLSKLTQ
ncbi:dTDP-4-dehydrorhamnose reductase [Mucilaginibacter phyllosphaerae]|uniref:dTDP-4-dehydrorhamnose reductase n=1 Tax=Mucilaginibacter phyllosphaerae TaxID=1812349 RepID=A0A4Y8AG07_9SPHI|nr:dTDP-4-dehydrorhamnose reductase [Mucilaginibacter phyllosphaerae]MBB3968656.1 dTDP-4-dehydrorhamnose reductase [Mucilaginibacter phyllosphaerae]TEW67707.1 dTDP-4-dehydrorhamnose reductase [Mucilaginibacter phyllosphaerae]GGH14673.1 NAD(P)-dependent oxidoreductase [Mucilaginibacter phyllosphaerae]